MRRNVFALFVFCYMFFEHVDASHNFSDVVGLDYKWFGNVTITTNKRTKDARKFDSIQLNDIYVKDNAVLIQSTPGTKSNEYYPKYEHSKKYDKYGKYGKNTSRTNMTKIRQNKNNTKKSNECKHYKKHKYQCTAFFITVDTDEKAVLLQSVRGEALTLAATHIPQNVFNTLIFSNKARGAHIPDNDLGVSYHYVNGTQTVARFRRDSQQANLVYETQVTEGWNEWINTVWGHFVTDMSMPKGSCDVDAYNLFSYEARPVSMGGWQQYDVHSETGRVIKTYLHQGACTDIYFYDGHCSRWICYAANPERTLYLRDPSTATNYIPPQKNNPLSSFFNHWSLSITAATFCGNKYVGLLGYRANAESAFFATAKVSRKYPYFEDIQTFDFFDYVVSGPLVIHSPPNTDIVYACDLTYFTRIDKAYSKVPVRTVHINKPGGVCLRIISFTRLYLSVYDCICMYMHLYVCIRLYMSICYCIYLYLCR